MPVAAPAGSTAASGPLNGGSGGGSSGTEKNIWVAAGEGDLERVRYLVDVQGLLPTVPDQWTYTPLHAAASYGQVDVLRFLLGHPSAPDSAIETTDEDGDTPLFAVEDVRVARVLVEDFGANATHENKAGDTPAAHAEENDMQELAAYFRSVTGELPMYQRAGELAEEEEEGVEGVASTTPAMDAAIEEQTEALMVRVQEILQRAEARGASSGEELTEAEEEELRRVVGESLFTQIREGWGVTVRQTVEQDAALPSASSSEHAANGADADSIDDEGKDDDEEEAVPQPGR